MAKIYHADLYGNRKDKYDFLMSHDITTLEWKDVVSEQPYYLFKHQDRNLLSEYIQGFKIIDIFPTTLLGANSHRDHFAINFTYAEADSKLSDFANPLLADSFIKNKYNLKDNRDWSLSKARQYDFSNIRPVICIYRPFDFRYMLYGSYAFDYHRPEINDNLLKDNLALISTRQTKEDFSIFATNKPSGQHKLATPYDGSYLSPLYIYPNSESEQGSLFTERTANFSSDFLNAIRDKLGYIPTPEAIFYYAYAIFHSPTYRQRYAEFLKIDFPRLPLTSNDTLFKALGSKGEELVQLHLMESKRLHKLITKYSGEGDNDVTQVKYHPKQQRVYINKTRYFEGIPPEVWEFKIGGYQVLDKWLKDRKKAKRSLSFDDILHYQRIVVALKETMQLMGEIDEIIPEFPIE